MNLIVNGRINVSKKYKNKRVSERACKRASKEKNRLNRCVRYLFSLLCGFSFTIHSVCTCHAAVVIVLVCGLVWFFSSYSQKSYANPSAIVVVSVIFCCVYSISTIHIRCMYPSTKSMVEST